MGFIRAYSARDMGDPFRLRVPKKLKKLKVGRALGSLARAGVGFIPGVGGILSSIIPGASPVPEAAQLPPAGQEWDEDNPGRGFRWVAPPQGHPAWGFARSNGWDMGDPKVLKRKMAAAGPKAKANRKANARAAKASGAGAGRLKGTSARGGRKGNIFSGLGGKVGSVIMGGLEGIPIAGGAIAAGEKEFNFGLGRVATRGGGGRRRPLARWEF